jgi:hypothetical protein
MAQHDLVVDNADGLTVRQDINAEFQALATRMAGTTAPALPYPNMMWLDTAASPYLLKQRDNANTGWSTIASIDASGCVPYRQGKPLTAATTAKVNLAAVTNPAAGDDANAGYAVGSRWLNTTTDQEFVCADATAGAAVWKQTTYQTTTAGALAIGSNANASSTNIIAIGQDASAAGTANVAIGQLAQIGGGYNVGIGYNARFAASQSYNVAIGYNINPGTNTDPDFDANVLIGRELLYTGGTVQKNGSAVPSGNTILGYRTISADLHGLTLLGTQNQLIGYLTVHHAGTGPITLGSYNVGIGSRFNEIQGTALADPLVIGDGTVTLGAWNNRNSQGAVTVNSRTVTIGYSNNRNSVAGIALVVGTGQIAIGNNNYDSGGVIGGNAIAIGTDCDTAADNAIAIGESCVVAKAGAVALGKGQTATNPGELAFGTAASYGMVTYVLATTTTDASTVELTTDGTSFIAIPAGKVFCFRAFQTTWNRTDGVHRVCHFGCGVIRNNAGAMTLVKAPIVVAGDGTENPITFAADDANDRFAIKITGKAAKTIETRVIVTGAFLGL